MFRFQKLLVSLLFVAVPLTGSLVQSNEIYLDAKARDAFLEKLEEDLGKIESLQVRFRQERDLSIFFEPVVSEGVLAFVRPDRLHWEWVTPYPSLLVLNRGRIERYDVVDGEISRMRPAGEEMLRSVAMQMSRWMQGRFRESSDLFEINVADGESPRIVLTTRSEGLRKALERVEIELVSDQSRVNRVSLFAPNGETTVMVFSNEQRNVALNDSLFDPAAPILIGVNSLGHSEGNGS